jgi:hypothetical protein
MASRKPRVVTSAVRAPFRSIRALVKSVVPWRTCETAAGGVPAWASTASMPATTASSGASGVVRTFPTWKVVPSSLARIRSVKVPPMSEPMRQLMGGRGRSARLAPR